MPGTANPVVEEQEREKQVEEQQEQQEVEMELETLQGQGEERAGVGQQPLEEVRESPAIEQARPQPLGIYRTR